MISDRTLFFVIALLLLFLTAVLVSVAVVNNMWREFLVSEMALAPTAIVLSILLRSPKKTNRNSDIRGS